MPYVKVVNEDRGCENCGNQFAPMQSTQRFCSLKCRKESQFKRVSTSMEFADKKEISSGTTGATHELLVCVDLMRRGYHVFRSQSPSCPCDLVAMLDGYVYKVEVTTGYKKVGGAFSYPQKSAHYDYDILAVVLHTGEIKYLAGEQAINLPGIPYSGTSSKKPS